MTITRNRPIRDNKILTCSHITLHFEDNLHDDGDDDDDDDDYDDDDDNDDDDDDDEEGVLLMLFCSLLCEVSWLLSSYS